jgi:hypothetical protein
MTYNIINSLTFYILISYQIIKTLQGGSNRVPLFIIKKILRQKQKSELPSFLLYVSITFFAVMLLSPSLLSPYVQHDAIITTQGEEIINTPNQKQTTLAFNNNAIEDFDRFYDSSIVSTSQQSFGSNSGQYEDLEDGSGNDNLVSDDDDIDSGNPSKQRSQGGLSSPNFLRYNDPALGFAIEYPSSSNIGEKDNGVSFLFEGGTFNIVVIKGTIVSPDEFASEVINTLKNQYRNFEIKEFRSIPIDGNPGFLLNYIYRDENSMQTYRFDGLTVVGNNGYIISFYAPEEDYRDFLPAALMMGSSFQFQSFGNEFEQGNSQSAPGLGLGSGSNQRQSEDVGGALPNNPFQ